MKKILFLTTLAAAFAFGFSSCSNEELVENIEQAQGAEIAFDTFADKLTKAENSSETALTDLEGHHTSFNVWGTKLIGTDNKVVYSVADAGKVEYGTDWTATPKKFWDKAAASYNFYAAAPANASWVFTFNSDSSDGTLTYADFTLKGVNAITAASTTSVETWKGVADDVDLMIASPCNVARASYNKADPEKVNLQFNHILSRLNVLVKKGTNLADEKVSLKELGIYKLINKGSFNEGATITGNLADGTIERWTNAALEGTYDLAGLALVDANPSKDNGVTVTAQYVGEWLLIPQDITMKKLDADFSDFGTTGSVTEDGAKNEAYIKVVYTINDEEFTGYYNLAAAFGKTTSGDKVAFCEGWQNNLTIVINPDAIEFDPQVFNWATKEEKSIEIPE